MTYETTQRGSTWTYSDSPTGGRREQVKKGVYVIDHRATGRFIVGSSNDVSREVDQHLQKLAKGKHPIRRLQINHDEEISRADPKRPQTKGIFVITEFALNSDKDIKRTLKEIRETNTTPYCLLN